MDKTSTLIDSLVESGAQKPMAEPRLQAALWFALIVGYMGIYMAIIGFRPDLAQKIGDPRYLIELGLLGCISASALYSAFCLARPDAYQSSHLHQYMPLWLFVVWCAVVFACGPSSSMSVDTFAYSITLAQYDCVKCIVVFSVPLAAALFFMIRRGAVIYTARAGGMAALAVTAFAYICLRLEEPMDDPTHLILWHGLPILLLCLCAALLGTRVFRWRT